MPLKFSQKIAKEIALKSFGHTLDCMLGYSDSDYSFNQQGDEFEDNFAEDLQEMNLTVNNVRLQSISKQYDKLKLDFEKSVRNKYKSLYKTK